MPSLDAILRANPAYIDSLYRRWLEDPESVDPTWGLFFAGYQMGGGNGAGAGNGAGTAVRSRASEEPIVLTARGAVPEGVEGEEIAPALRLRPPHLPHVRSPHRRSDPSE
jgi:2-oxoglutarate dehydrogenase complex dehydrogenase (E1) component-like enzyme